jgi:hypothetical protein
MRIDLYGLAFETPRVSFYLWSPWRAAALEHRLFEAVRELLGSQPEAVEDGHVLHVSDPKTWRNAVGTIARILKGWQEEAEPGRERRGWCWLLEGDTDAYGYDHTGEPASLWATIRLVLDHGGPGEEQGGESIDLEGFGLRIWPANS